MSDDEENLCKFGTPLEPLKEDEVPSKRPILISDQIATDSNGRRRFHGAFTGGFSAGYWNTVGSQEGWKPQEFKSSRTEKAAKHEQKPKDFMDDEDLGEFGIAPQRIQTTEDFTPDDDDKKKGTRKRKSVREPEGPIPGQPVLNMFLDAKHDKVAVRLLKKMGWKECQGIGARVTRKEKHRAKEAAKMYQVDLGPLQKDPGDIATESSSSGDDLDDEGNEITFAPDNFEPLIMGYKDNRKGLGYLGLSRDTFNQTDGKQLEHINLFSTFEMVDRKANKKLSIAGQAFGVGAFEEDDDDIFARDNMNQYDFTLDEKKRDEQKAKKIENKSGQTIEGFVTQLNALKLTNKIFKVDVPESYTPRNWAVRKTRFSPAVITTTDSEIDVNRKIGRHDMTPEDRGKLLRDPKDKSEKLPIIKPKLDVRKEVTFNSSSIEQSSTERSGLTTAKIFLEDIKKQEIPKVAVIEQLNVDRFVKEGADVEEKKQPDKSESESKPRKIEVKRTTETWKPCSLLMKLMNVAEHTGQLEEKTKSFSLFQCLASGSTRKEPTFSRAKYATDELEEYVKLKDVQSHQSNRLNSDPIKKIESVVIVDKQDKPSQSRSSVVPLVGQKLPKKTELELKVLKMQTVHPSEKKDLFKAIFESSDEDDVNQDTEISKSTEESNIKRPDIQSDLGFLPKTAKDFNILRNSSPPRGIFSHLSSVSSAPPTGQVQNLNLIEKPPEIGVDKESDQPTKIQFIRKEYRHQDSSPVESNLYGPTLPISPPKSVSSQQLVDVSTTDLAILKHIKSTGLEIVEEWVEKGSSTDKKKKKKHSKDKKRHKKDKREKKSKKRDR